VIWPAAEYAPLPSRWPPLLYLGLFAVQGLVTARALAGRDLGDWGRRVLLGTLLTSQLGLFLLLRDHPVLAAGETALLWSLGSVLFVRRQRSGWSLLPYATGWSTLVALTGRLGPEIPGLPLLLVWAGTAAIVAGLLIDGRRAGHLARVGPRFGLLLPGLLLGLLDLLWLVPGSSRLAAGLTVGLAGGYLLLGLVLGSTGIGLTAVVARLVALQVIGVHGLESAHEAVLLLTGAWALLGWAATGVDLLGRARPATPGRIAQPLLVGAGLLLVAQAVLPEAATTPRGLLALGVALVLLLLGLGLQRRASRPAAAADGTETKTEAAPTPLASPRITGRPADGLLLGAALFAFWGSGLLWSGVQLTCAWAVLTTLLAAVAGRLPHHCWLVAFVVACLAVFGHFAATDLGWVEEQRRLFWSSQGLQGLLLPAPFGHPRAWGALLVLGTFVLGAWLLGPRRRPDVRPAATILLVAGHLLALVLAVGEAHLVATRLPVLPPAPFGSDVAALWHEALADQRTKLAMVKTVVLAAYAGFLLLLGFVAGSKLHRLLGIGLFGVALAKLALVDVWSLERVYQIVVLVTLGASLLAGGFLYARFRERIRSP